MPLRPRKRRKRESERDYDIFTVLSKMGSRHMILKSMPPILDIMCLPILRNRIVMR